MRATTAHLLTWKQFEQYPDDGMHHELIEGEEQVLPPPKSKHTIIAHAVFNALHPLGARGRVLFEAGYKLTHDPATWIPVIADVSAGSEIPVDSLLA